MKTINILKDKVKSKALKAGKIVFFSNESFQNEIEGDDIREGDITYFDRTDNFNVWFNGKLIHSSRTLDSALRRTALLFDKWNLKLK